MILLTHLLFLLTVQTDTLTQVYSERWDGYETDEGWFSSIMTSNDMIFVVLGVSLLIWFTVLTYLFITEKKLSRIEKEFNDITT